MVDAEKKRDSIWVFLAAHFGSHHIIFVDKIVSAVGFNRHVPVVVGFNQFWF
jgi:hypothetical protein